MKVHKFITNVLIKNGMETDRAIYWGHVIPYFALGFVGVLILAFV